MLAQQSWPEYFAPGLPAEARFRHAEAMTGLDRASLAAKFESLGNDCEFGFFQRHCGADAMGLFRFSNPHHTVILDGVSTNFRNFCEDLSVELDVQTPRREWIIVDRQRRLREHTFIWEGDRPEDAVRATSLTRSQYLRRMMIENMHTADKIFVIKSGQGHLDEAKAAAIAEALRRWGPNWLLWVEPGQQVGSVVPLAPGLLRGTIDRLTVPGDGTELSYAGWLAVIGQAYVAVQACRARERRPSAA